MKYTIDFLEKLRICGNNMANDRKIGGNIYMKIISTNAYDVTDSYDITADTADNTLDNKK